MNDRIDELRARRLLRTSWVTDARLCPVHRTALELCFDITDLARWSDQARHDENRVGWRCEGCVGVWLENHFIYGSRRPLVEAPPRLKVRCTSCGSLRVTHVCVPACCGDHECLDCHATLAISATVIEHGAAPDSGSDEVDWRNAFEFALESVRTPILWSAEISEFRPCKRCGEPCELAIVGEATAGVDTTCVVWHCDACRRFATERSYHRARYVFEADAEAACDCPDCGEGRLITRDGGEVRCDRCGATAEIHVADRSPRRRVERRGDDTGLDRDPSSVERWLNTRATTAARVIEEKAPDASEN